MKNKNEFELLKEIFLLEKNNISWKKFFEQELDQDYFYFLLSELKKNYDFNICFPKKENIFRIFREISLDEIKVVILGQDPYHIEGVADGFAFSTEKEGYTPKSLKNIFLELKNDLNINNKNNSLLPWIKEGVFLINTSLSVEKSKPLSHLELWKKFSFSLFNYINKQKIDLVWLFWGARAREFSKICCIDLNNSLFSSHPSPYSFYNGFYNSFPFSKTNKIMLKQNKKIINWKT